MKMTKKQQNCQSADVLSNIDILEEILVRVPPEFIPKYFLVSRHWFGLIRSSSFCEHYTKRWRHVLPLVGFKGFYVRNSDFFRTPITPDYPMSYDWDYARLFLSTHKEHDHHGPVFGQYDYVIDCSSDGILLIGRQSYPFTFIVHNPFTNKHHELPQPRENYKHGCMAFEVEYYGNGLFNYKVTRAKASASGRSLNEPVSIQTFSSKTGRWEERTLPSFPELKLFPRRTGIVIKGVIHWLLCAGGVAIYDPNVQNQGFVFVRSPDREKIRRHWVLDHGESSDGLYQYANKCVTDMKIWVLKIEYGDCAPDYSNYKWICRYKIDFDIVFEKNLSLCQGYYHFKQFFWVSYLPQNSEYVFLRLEDRIFLLHIASGTLEEIHYECEAPCGKWHKARGVIPYFKWACPWPNLLINKSF